MASRKLKFHDGITESEVHFNEDDTIDVKRTQKVDWIDSFRHESEFINRKAQGRIAARVPMDLHLAWVREWKEKHSDKWELQTFLAMKVNSPDYKHLRNQTL